MKNVKRALALFTMICMLLTIPGALQAVAAPDPAVALSEGFDSFADNTDYATEDLSVEFRTADAKAEPDIFRFINEKGAFGKNASDGALKMGTKSPVTTSKENLPETTTQATLTNQKDISVSAGQFYELSFEFALSGNNSITQFRGYYGDDPQAQKQIHLMQIDNGRITNLFNASQTSNVSINTNFVNSKWYRIRAVIQAGEAETSHYWIYVDGVLVRQDDFTTSGPFTGLNSVKVLKFNPDLSAHVGKGTTYESDAVPTLYLDNYEIRASAEMPAAGDYTAGYDFDALTDSEDVSAISNELGAKKGIWEIAGLQNASGGRVEGGVLGKAAGDKSIYLNKVGKAYPDATSMVTLQPYGWDTNGKLAAAVLKQGEFANVEVYMAWDGSDDIKSVQGFYISRLSGDGKAEYPFIEITAAGAVRALGKSAEGVVLSKNRWYKFNLVLHAGDGKAASESDQNWLKLYINDEPVIGQTVFAPKQRGGDGKLADYDYFMGLQRIWLASQSTWGVGASLKPDTPDTQSGTYFDDFSMTYTATEPVFTPPVLNYDTDYARMAMNGRLAGYVGSGMRGAKLAVDGAEVKIVDSAGNEGEAFTGGTDYIRITKTNGSKLFGVADGSKRLVQNIKDFTETEGSVNLQDFNYAPKAFTSYLLGGKTEGAAGKTAGDTFAVLETADAYQDNNDNLSPFVQMLTGSTSSLKALNHTDTYTVEMTVRADGQFSAVNLQFVSDIPAGKTADNRRNLASINPGGYIVSVDGEKVGYRMGEWVKLAVTVYPAVNMAQVYANGQLVHFGSFWSEGYENAKLARFKLEQMFPATGETDKRSGSLCFDDVKVYNGVYSPERIELVSGYADVYNTGRVIFTNDASYVEFIEDTAGYSTVKVPVLYADASLTEPSNEFGEGTILAVSNDAGDLIQYYYISEGEPADLKVTEITNSNGTPAGYAVGKNDLRVHMRSFKPLDAKNMTMILAEKDAADSTLLSTGNAVSEMNAALYGMGGDEYGYPAAIESGMITLNIAKPRGESKLELYIWDGLDTLSPLAKKVSVNR